MPIYDYFCRECNKKWEGFRKVDERAKEVCECGSKASILVSKPADPMNYNYYDNALGAQITSKGQRDKLMKDKGLVAVG